jgi:hypothetical protein
MQPGPTAKHAFRSTEELEIINFGDPSYDWPLKTLLSFHNRAPCALTAGPSSSSTWTNFVNINEVQELKRCFKLCNITYLYILCIVHKDIVCSGKENNYDLSIKLYQRCNTLSSQAEYKFVTHQLSERNNNTHTRTNHSRHIPRELQRHLRDAHVLPKLFSYEKYCKRER